MHWNEVSLLFIIIEHVPLFKHGLLEHGLESLWHAFPVLYWSHWHTYCCSEFSTHEPWLEQFPKHADKSPVYPDKTPFNWLPVLFEVNKLCRLDIDVVVKEVDKVDTLFSKNKLQSWIYSSKIDRAK